MKTMDANNKYSGCGIIYDMKGAVNKKGLTLVELSLSLVFIGVLSLTAVLIINNTVLAYQRGLTLNKINDVGMDLVDDMRTVVQGSPVKLDAGCAGEDDGDPSCMYFEQKNDSGGVNNVPDNVPDNAPLYGGFCTGKYSYLWRTGYLDGIDVGVKIKGSRKYWLAKIKDDKRQICNDYRANYGDEIDYDVEFEELIPSDSRLAIYDLYVPMPARSDAIKTMFYSISFVLGTRGGGVNIMAEGDYCAPPEGDNSNFNYCAINKFNFAAQAGGMKK